MGADPVAAMTGERPIGVAIVDDHPVVVEGVRAWLATEPRLTVLATGDDPDEVLRVAPDADVVLLDLRLHGRMALDKLAELSTAGRRVVVYSEHTDPQTMLAALDAGAVAFLAKHEGREHCVATVLAAASDRPYVPPALAGAMVGDRDRHGRCCPTRNVRRCCSGSSRCPRRRWRAGCGSASTR